MNERIKELAEQAGVESNFNGYNAWYNEKFAELIVQECIKSIQGCSMNSGDEWEDGLKIAEGAIEELFGIEE